MGRHCSICSHPNRDQIDSLIARNEGSAHAIARQFSLSKDAVLRHKAHIAPQIERAQLAKFTDFQELVEEVRKLSDKFDRMNRKPQGREAWDLFLAKSKNVREWIWLKTKMAGRILVDAGEDKSKGGDTYCVQFISPNGEPARIPLTVYARLKWDGKEAVSLEQSDNKGELSDSNGATSEVATPLTVTTT